MKAQFFISLLGAATLLTSNLAVASEGVSSARHFLADAGSRNFTSMYSTPSVRQDLVQVPVGDISVKADSGKTQLTVTMKNSDSNPLSIDLQIDIKSISEGAEFKVKMTSIELAALKLQAAPTTNELVTVGTGTCKESKCEVKVNVAGIPALSLEVFSTPTRGVYFSNISIDGGTPKTVTLREKRG